MRPVRLVVGLMTTLLLATGCLSDQRWLGTVDRCSGSGNNSFRAIMLLDGPVGPSVTGYFGYALDDLETTWFIGAMEDVTNIAGRLRFQAVFDNGNGTDRWDVDMAHAPLGDYDGEVEILSNSNTTRCDITLSPES
jgi:hypothetical protein